MFRLCVVTSVRDRAAVRNLGLITLQVIDVVTKKPFPIHFMFLK